MRGAELKFDPGSKSLRFSDSATYPGKLCGLRSHSRPRLETSVSAVGSGQAIINEKGSTRRCCVSAWRCFGNSGALCFAFQWTFSYTGFPVEPNTVYFIGAHNIPNANMNEDPPSVSVNFTSPGKPPLPSVWLGCLPRGVWFGSERLGGLGKSLWPRRVWFPHL